jgi:hypothetical protein
MARARKGKGKWHGMAWHANGNGKGKGKWHGMAWHA